MIEDTVRTGAYHAAIMRNKHLFEGKVVLDIGAGTGILSIFAAKAGARKVYAVEATAMASRAKQIIAANGLDDRIEVIRTMVEKLELEEKVDVIISEWMGYMLLREAMLDSVIKGREKWLKEGGVMFPSHASVYLAPIRMGHHARQQGQHDEAVEDWYGFVDETQSLYDLDLSCLNKQFEDETVDYFLQTSHWCELENHNLVGPATKINTLDLRSCSMDDIQELSSSWQLQVTAPGTEYIDGVVGYFDVDFDGSPQNPVEEKITLSTGPGPRAQQTHWGQMAFLMHPPLQSGAGAKIDGTSRIFKRGDNMRLLGMESDIKVTNADGSEGEQRKKVLWNVD
jgi:protein arginine N-methyltransferase 1